MLILPTSIVLSIIQTTDIVLWYMDSKRPKEVIKHYRRKYSDEPPTKRTIYQVYLKFKNTRTTHNQNTVSGRPKMARSEVHINSVRVLRDAISDDPKTSIRMMSA